MLASRRALQSRTLPGSIVVGGIEAELTALMMAQDSTAIQMLFEVILIHAIQPSSNLSSEAIQEGASTKNVMATEVATSICMFIHRI